MVWLIVAASVLGIIVLVTVYDLLQRRHTILRNFPIVGHLRYILEKFGPELRQYIVTSNDEERPFSRNQRRWVYSSAKRENNQFGFGSDNHVDRDADYLIIKPSWYPHQAPAGGDRDDYPLPCAKVMGAARGRTHAFRPSSVVNVSGMSFGALSAAAVSAMNEGCAIADCLHNTGEGGLSPYHQRGGDLIFQIGTAYFGCRDERGAFSLPRLVDLVQSSPVRAVEIKLSQGAKPGLGGHLPGAKVTEEIAATRGVPVGVDCTSPGTHTAFRTIEGMLEFVESIADATGLPVGIKAAVGDTDFWRELARLMVEAGQGVDFVTIDGGEGGTGAAPLVFADHVALPYRFAMARVYREFAYQGLQDDIVFIGSGKLGLPETALMAFALGADMVNVGREAMMAIGCIQAQKCHTGHCPVGIATQSKWLQRGLDPTSKAVRMANYVAVLRRDLTLLSRACGEPHPSLVTLEHMEFLNGTRSTPAAERFDYQQGWSLPRAQDQREIRALMKLAGRQTPEDALALAAATLSP